MSKVPWTRDLDPTRYCPECGERRGNRKDGWNPITRKDTVTGWTCPECPAATEPIRRWGKDRERFRAVVGYTPSGESKRKQLTKTLPTLEEARAWVERMRSEVASHGSADRTKLTVEQLLNEWIEDVDVREPTRANYRHQMKPVIRRLGDVLVVDLTISDVEDLTRWMKREGRTDGKPYGKWSLMAARQRLSQALDMAIRQDLIQMNPVAYAPKIKHDRPKGSEVEHWPTVGEGEAAVCSNLATFRKVSDEERLAGLWRLSLCGMTRADLMGLKWHDIDLDKGIIETVSRGRVILDGASDYVAKPKSEARNRPIAFEVIEPGTSEILKSLRDLQKVEAIEVGRVWSEDDFVALNEVGEPMRPELYSDQFERLCERAGVPVIALHSLRHTLALLMARKGVALEDAAALLGHTPEVHQATYRPKDRKFRATRAAKALGEVTPARS